MEDIEKNEERVSVPYSKCLGQELLPILEYVHIFLISHLGQGTSF
jgi:hypothetical protein